MQQPFAWIQKVGKAVYETAFQLLDARVCLFCGRGLPYREPQTNTGFSGERLTDLLCPDCLSNLPLRPCVWEKLQAQKTADSVLLLSFFDYVDPVRQSIHQLKFSQNTAVARLMGEVAYFYLQQLPYHPAGLVPIPLGSRRLQERGYNQSEWIARKLGCRMGIPVLSQLLFRRVETSPQTEQRDRESRQRNMEKVFQVKMDAYAESYQGRPLLLIDDVVTTGSTLLAASQTLKSQGFTVRALSCARD